MNLVQSVVLISRGGLIFVILAKNEYYCLDPFFNLGLQNYAILILNFSFVIYKITLQREIIWCHQLFGSSKVLFKGRQNISVF